MKVIVVNIRMLKLYRNAMVHYKLKLTGAFLRSIHRNQSLESLKKYTRTQRTGFVRFMCSRNREVAFSIAKPVVSGNMYDRSCHKSFLIISL